MMIPFLWAALGLASGIVAEKYCPVPVVWLSGALPLGIGFAWLLRGQKYFPALFILIMGCAGALWTRLDAHTPPDAVQNFAGAGKMILRGTVDSLPEVKTRGQRNTVSFVLKASSITIRESVKRRYRKVRGRAQVFLLQSVVLPQVGDSVWLYGELSAPRAVLNPGEFDYGDFLAQKNVRAIFQTIGAKSVRVTKVGNPWAPSRVIAETRRRLAALMDQRYKPEESAILKALVLGLRSDVAAEVRDQFMKTGTIHLFATANTKRNFAPFSNKNIAAYSS